MRDLKSLENALNVITSDGITRQKWFVSFGSLLYIIRDKKLGKEFTQDIDISIIGPHDYSAIKNGLEEDGFKLVSHIRNDITDEVLFADFRSPNGLSIDLFFWIEEGDRLWHTYNFMNEKIPEGIPEQYHFKSVPKWMMEGEPYKYEWFDGISPMRIPAKYGTLLDYWYPHWYVPNLEFGVSQAAIIHEPKTCQHLFQGVLK
jgi:hypothetical protein